MRKPKVAQRKSAEDLIIEARIRGHLRQQMKERGIDRMELARRLGCDQASLWRILNGERGIGLGMVVRISQGLHIGPTRLIEEDAPEEYRDDAALDLPKNHARKK